MRSVSTSKTVTPCSPAGAKTLARCMPVTLCRGKTAPAKTDSLRKYRRFISGIVRNTSAYVRGNCGCQHHVNAGCYSSGQSGGGVEPQSLKDQPGFVLVQMDFGVSDQ